MAKTNIKYNGLAMCSADKLQLTLNRDTTSIYLHVSNQHLKQAVLPI